MKWWRESNGCAAKGGYGEDKIGGWEFRKSSGIQLKVYTLFLVSFCKVNIVMLNIIGKRKIYFIISGALVGASIAVIALFGLNLGLDFKGGSLSEITVKPSINVDINTIASILTGGEKPVLKSVAVQEVGNNAYILRFEDVTQDAHENFLRALRTDLAKYDSAKPSDGSLNNNTPGANNESSAEAAALDVNVGATDLQGNPIDIKFAPAPGVVAQSADIIIGGEEIVAENRYESIGPIVGQELRSKSIYAIIMVLLGIILYISWAFRKVSEPVSSWKYGLAAIIALIHDVVIPTGVFVILGKVAGVEIDILFVTALLTILGFSVNDTIVVFDRTRENLARVHGHSDFEGIVNKSVNQTMTRSIYTSATVFLVLLAIYIFGGGSIKNFTLTLMIGVVVGTYSSIFIASPLLVEWEHWRRK